jgi:hypothetical protein
MNGLEGLEGIKVYSVQRAGAPSKQEATQLSQNPSGLEGLEGIKVYSVQQKGDSWPALLGKSALKGITSIGDLPNLIASGAEGLQNYHKKNINRLVGKPLFEETNYSSYVPTTNDARQVLKNYTDIDLEPRPTTTGQRIASTATDFGGSLLGGGLLGNFAKAGSLPQKFLGTIKNTKDAVRQAAIGSTLGGASGVLQEGGVDPITASIAPAVTLPLGVAGIKSGLRGSKNLLSKFSAKGYEQQLRQMAADQLINKVGEKNVPIVLERLNAPAPLGIKPTTAEAAQNTGIASLHRALSPNIPAIAEKDALNDAILRKRLAEIMPYQDISPEYTGETVRNSLSKNLETAKNKRAEITNPLYEKLNEVTTPVELPQTTEFLQQQNQYAKGNIKKNLNYLEDIIKSNKAPKSDLNNFNELYGNFGAAAQSQLKKEMLGSPIPIELTNALKDISGRIGTAKKAGNNEVARILSEAKEKIMADMAAIPEEQAARSAYAALSKPVSAIEKEPLLSKFVKKDEFNKDFLLSPEKIPDMILSGNLNNVKALVSQIKGDKKTMDVVRSSVVDKLLNSSELVSINAQGQANLSYNKYNNFLKKNKKKLELILEPEQVSVLENVREVLKKRQAVSTMGRAVASNTQADTTLVQALAAPVDSIAKKFLRTIPGGKFAMPFYDAAKGYEKQQIKFLLEEALLDPEKAKLLLTPAKNIKNEKTLSTILEKIYTPNIAYPVLDNINAGLEE